VALASPTEMDDDGGGPAERPDAVSPASPEEILQRQLMTLHVELSKITLTLARQVYVLGDRTALWSAPPPLTRVALRLDAP